jgi:lipopolysaccharide exporter
MTTGTSFGSALTRGSIWMIVARWATRLIGLVSTVILARLLAPSDFGVIAMALIAAGLLETISYAGVDLALMREGNNSRDHYNTAWTIQIIQAAFIAALLIGIAPLAAAYFSEPRAIAIIQLLALKSLIDGTQNIGIVAFRKEFDFAKEFRFMVYTKLLNFVIVVGLAFALRNYWALAIGSTTASAIGVGLSYAMHPYRPRWCLTKVKEIWSFSQWLMISRVGAFLNRRADEFVIGGMVGANVMGGYHVASELATMPSNELVMPMRRALFPALASLPINSPLFGAAVQSTFATVAAACLGVSFGLLSAAPEVVTLILGQKWVEVIPLVQWLALFGGFSALVLVLEVPLWVSGRTNSSALQTWVELAILVPLVYMAARRFGVEGAAITRAAVATAMIPVMMVLTARAGYISSRQLLAALWRPLASGLAMAAVLFLLPFGALGSVALALVAKIVLGALVYLLSMVVLWIAAGRPDGVETMVKTHVLSMIARRRTASP